MNPDNSLKQLLNYFLKLFLFWMFLFFIQHSLFLIVNHKELQGIPTSHILLSYAHAISLDISSVCYLMFLPLIILSIGAMTNSIEKHFIVAKWVNYFLIIFYLCISFIGIALYINWGTKINSKALSFIIYPKEIAGIIFDIYNILYFGAMLAIIIPALLAFKRIFRNPHTIKPGLIRTLIFFIFFSGIMLVGARGGFHKYPINKSSCFYSKYPVLNFAALNDFWNFSAIIINPEIKKNPYIFFTDKTADKTVEELYSTEKDSTEFVLTTSRPNIVFIVLESFSADAVACLGGEKGIAPCFDSLAKEGLLFTNFYATGFRTDQGVVALLSSFAAQPRSSIIKNFDKFDKLSNLIKTMNQNGYYTSFYYGGDLSYANTKTYLTLAGTDKMLGENDIPHSRRTDWGAYDEDVFAFHLNELTSMKQPFFTMMLSLTNHEYFVADIEKVFPEKTENGLYHNTAHYTDKCLYNYLQEAKKTDWYKNTLFIITADHAHRHPLERAYNEPARHHIPLLFYGNVIKPEYRGQTFNKTGSHVDIAATLLAQLRIKNQDFEWSKNLLNNYTRGFAFYSFDDGFGFITDTSEVVYDHNLKSAVLVKNKIDGADPIKTLKNGKAYLQKLFHEYILL